MAILILKHVHLFSPQTLIMSRDFVVVRRRHFGIATRGQIVIVVVRLFVLCALRVRDKSTMRHRMCLHDIKYNNGGQYKQVIGALFTSQ